MGKLLQLTIPSLNRATFRMKRLTMPSLNKIQFKMKRPGMYSRHSSSSPRTSREWFSLCSRMLQTEQERQLCSCLSFRVPSALRMKQKLCLIPSLSFSQVFPAFSKESSTYSKIQKPSLFRRSFHLSG